MNHKLKSLMSMLLAVMCVLGCTMCAFAAEIPDGWTPADGARMVIGGSSDEGSVMTIGDGLDEDGYLVIGGGSNDGNILDIGGSIDLDMNVDSDGMLGMLAMSVDLINGSDDMSVDEKACALVVVGMSIGLYAPVWGVG